MQNPNPDSKIKHNGRNDRVLYHSSVHTTTRGAIPRLGGSGRATATVRIDVAATWRDDKRITTPVRNTTDACRTSAGDTAMCINTGVAGSCTVATISATQSDQPPRSATWSTATHDDERSPREACKSELPVAPGSENAAVPARVPTDARRWPPPPWRLWRRHRRHRHECIARVRPSLAEQEALQAPAFCRRTGAASSPRRCECAPLQQAGSSPPAQYQSTAGPAYNRAGHAGFRPNTRVADGMRRVHCVGQQRCVPAHAQHGGCTPGWVQTPHRALL